MTDSSVLFQLVSQYSKKVGAHGQQPVKSLIDNALVRTESRPVSVPAPRQEVDPSLFLSLQTFEVIQFDDLFEPCAGYRLHAGEMWLSVTPELLGWMSARIEVGLRPSIVSEDLGQAIDLFHRARDLSGLEPVTVSPNWSPPGIGIKAPPEWR